MWRSVTLVAAAFAAFAALAGAQPEHAGAPSAAPWQPPPEDTGLRNSTFAHRDAAHRFPAAAVAQLDAWLARPGQHFYPNVSAVFHGQWAQGGDGGPGGELRASLTAVATDNARVNDVLGAIALKTPDGAAWFPLQGVHLVEHGVVVLMASETQNAFALLPFAMPSEPLFDLVQGFVDERVNAPDRTRLLDSILAHRRTESALQLNISRECEPVLVLQLAPLPSDVRLASVRQLEKELMDRTGLPTMAPLALDVQGLLFARNESCACTAVNMTASGTRLPVYYSKLTHYAVLAVVTALLELLLTCYQVDRLTSSSALARVSAYTMGTLCVLDMFQVMLHFMSATTFDHLYRAFALASFLKMVLFGGFEMRLLVLAWKASTGTTSVDDERGGLNALYRFYYGTILLILLIVYAGGDVLVRGVSFLLHGFWVPQIVHAVRTNTRRGLTAGYIVGMSVLRCIVPLYLLLCPANVFGVDTSPLAGGALVAFLGLQALVLLLQNLLGPCFFLPESWSPPTYNYYVRATLTASDVEAGHRADEINCVVCMLPVDLTAKHMLTPCGHRFHSECLEPWLQLKLECPTCRAPLPALT